MELTPNEMKNHQFANQMRGYDKEEVKAFIDGAAGALENAFAENEKLNRDNQSLNVRYEELKGLEDTIRSAVLEAQKNANQIIANAKKESELILSEAKLESEKTLDSKQKQMGDLEQKIQKLEYTKEQFYSKLRSEIEAHLKLVDSICPPDKGMQSEEMTSEQNGDKDKKAIQKANDEPESSELNMQDDEIDAALENLSGTTDKAPADEVMAESGKVPILGNEGSQDEPKDGEMVNVGESSNTSDEKEDVQDGPNKGYDF